MNVTIIHIKQILSVSKPFRIHIVYLIDRIVSRDNSVTNIAQSLCVGKVVLMDLVYFLQKVCLNKDYVSYLRFVNKRMMIDKLAYQGLMYVFSRNM